MHGNDEIEALPERLLGGEAEHDRSRAIPALDRSCPIGKNDGVAAPIDTLPRVRSMIVMPSVGSIALIKTPVPTPDVSLETFSMNELP